MILLAIGLVPWSPPAVAGGTTVQAEMTLYYIGGQLQAFTPDGWTCLGGATPNNQDWTMACTPDAPGTYRCRTVTVDVAGIGLLGASTDGDSYCDELSSGLVASCGMGFVNGASFTDCPDSDTGGAPPPFRCHLSITGTVVVGRVHCTVEAVVF